MSDVTWTPPQGYRMVMDILHGGYAKGFDRGRSYTFLRHGQDRTSVFRLIDQSPFFNLAGLYFRGLPESIAP